MCIVLVSSHATEDGASHVLPQYIWQSFKHSTAAKKCGENFYIERQHLLTKIFSLMVLKSKLLHGKGTYILFPLANK